MDVVPLVITETFLLCVVKKSNDPGLEEICRLDEKKCLFEYSADKPFSKMESGKSINTLLNVTQVFVYCFVYINSMDVFFGETILLGLFKMKSVLVWT